jgi:hypothetical protein
MAEAYAVVRYSEEVPILSGTFAPVSGTITLSSVTVTLRDATGAIVAGCNGVPATAFTSGASAAPYASYTLSFPELSLSAFTIQQVYTLTFLATDSLENTYESVICIVGKPDGS